MAYIEEYAYEIIDNMDDARICTQLLAEEFSQYERLTSFYKISAQSLFDALLPRIKDLLGQRLSFLARHRPSGEIVGAVIADDLYEKHKNYSPDSPPATYPSRDLVNELINQFIHNDFDQELKPHLVAYILLGATRAQHTGKDVGSRLRAMVCNQARIQGFQYVLVQVSSPATRHIYTKKLGGKELSVIDPTTWIWKKKGDGSCPFKECHGDPIPNILIRLTSDSNE
ncbi:unnamed protein product [Rotaria sordida]|uniref:N-acetyltransferase domain-containing protein n=1 Tax=Rotaria sordida TaxID=392033 RepID=A0A819P9T2_9BILA|nr:unnamed protein product [Rotaria sordida]